MKVICIQVLLIALSLHSFSKKEYSNYDAGGVRYFLNALYHEQTGNAERAEENFQIAFLRSNSDAVKLNLSVRNLITGKKDEGFRMLKELYESGYNLGRFGIYLYLSYEPGKPEAYTVLDKIVSDLNELGEINTAATVLKQRMADGIYSFFDPDGFIEFVKDLYPQELNSRYEFFFNSVLFLVHTRLKKVTGPVESIIEALEKKYGEIPYSFYSMAFNEYLKLGEYEMAEKTLRKMDRYNYEETGYYYFNSEFSLKRSEADKARNILIEGIRKLNDSTLKMKLASLDMSRNDFSGAEIIFDSIISENPDNDQIYKIISNEYSKAGNDEFTVKFFEKALEKFPEDPELLNNYSYSLAVMGKELDRALEMVEKALNLRKGSVTFLDTKAWVLYRLGRHVEAEEIMDVLFSDESIYFHPSSDELFAHYKDIKEALNKAETISNISINRTAVELSGIIAECTYMLEAGF